MRVFEGIKIADFGWAGVGPIISKYFADYGATVVHIESSTRPDLLRTSSPFKEHIPGINRSGYFPVFNANKYGFALNLNHPKGIEVAKRLVSWAGIVVENFAGGIMEKRGLGYEELKKVRPDVIMLRCCNQGQTGPHASHPGFGTQLVGLAGFTYLTSWADREPVQPYGAYTDIVAPHFAYAALVAALIYRNRTGKGQCLDLSQYETGVHFLAPVILSYNVNGREMGQMGNSCPSAAPHGVYRCRGNDRWCAIAVFTDEEWQSFCQVIGNPPWTQDAKFKTIIGRKRNEDELNRLIEEWTINFSAEEVMNLMQTAGVAAGVVENAKDVLDDPQLKHRDAIWRLAHSEIGAALHIGATFLLSETPAEARMAAPCLGEHTEYVCREFLGMSDDEFVRLFADGVFE